MRQSFEEEEEDEEVFHQMPSDVTRGRESSQESQES